MRGTTRCPYCHTRFKVSEAQMETHNGMVRCGHCRQTFDARPAFLAEQTGKQLELPILDMPVAPPPTLPVLEPMTLAEQVAIVPDEDDSEHKPRQRTWPWTIATMLALMLLLAQVAYFFRIELAARQPALKPALIAYCHLLKCEVPLPQHAELISIESSELEALPGQAGRVALNVLLRNRAAYVQAYPMLELTLTDSRDSALARRTFRPSDYLLQGENRTAGMPPNRELPFRLNLDVADIRPMGYRLMLSYPLR